MIIGRSSRTCPPLTAAIALLRQIYRRWRLHPRHRLSKARAHRSGLRHLSWRWIETIAGLTILLCLLAPSPLTAQTEVLIEALQRSDDFDGLVELARQVETEIVLPTGEAVTNGWLELTSLTLPEIPPLAMALPEREADAPPLRWTPHLPNGPAMLCYAAEGFALRCQEMYLYRGLQGDYLGPLEVAVEWRGGTPVRGRYLSRGLPLAAARVALVPADLQAQRPFTAPLGPPEGGGRKLQREVATGDDGVFQLPAVAAGEYFLETLLPSGQVHRSDVFRLPEERLNRQRVAAEAGQPVVWDLGDFEALQGLSVEVRVQSTLGEMISGARITARQGDSIEQLTNFQATTGGSGIVVLSGFRAEDAVRVSCAAPGYLSYHAELPTVPPLVLCDLQPMAKLSGLVVSASDDGLSSAWVTLTPLPPEDADEPTEGAPPKDDGLGDGPLADRPDWRSDDTRWRDGTPPEGAAPRSQAVTAEGTFAFSELAAGRYRLDAAAPDHEVLSQEIFLDGGEDQQLGPLRLMKGRQVELIVVDADSGAALEGVDVQSLDPPGAVDGVTDAKGELAFATRGDRGLVIQLRHRDYAEARRRLSAEDLRQDRPFEGGPIRLTLHPPGWVRVVIHDEALGAPCRGCTVILSPPGVELQTDELGHVLSPPLEPGSYRVYRPRLTHLGSTVVEQPDAERRYAKVKAGKTSLVRFGEARQSLRLTFEPALPAGWGLRVQTPYHAERLEAAADGSFEVRHKAGEALDVYLLHYDRSVDKLSEIRLGTLPANPTARELQLKLRRSAIRGQLTDWSGHPLAGKAVELASLERQSYAKVWTDADGNFHIPFAPEGVFGLHIGQRSVRFVSVSPSQTVDVGNVQLEAGSF